MRTVLLIAVLLSTACSIKLHNTDLSITFMKHDDQNLERIGFAALLLHDGVSATEVRRLLEARGASAQDAESVVAQAVAQVALGGAK